MNIQYKSEKNHVAENYRYLVFLGFYENLCTPDI